MDIKLPPAYNKFKEAYESGYKAGLEASSSPPQISEDQPTRKELARPGGYREIYDKWIRLTVQQIGPEYNVCINAKIPDGSTYEFVSLVITHKESESFYDSSLAFPVSFNCESFVDETVKISVVELYTALSKFVSNTFPEMMQK